MTKFRPLSKNTMALLTTLFVCWAAPAGSAAADEPMVSKTLKYAQIQADKRVWTVGKDKLDDEGDAVFDLQHRATEGDISINLQEIAHEYGAPAHAAYWSGFVASMKKRFVAFNVVPVPSEIKPPKAFECSASQQPLSGAMVETTHLSCSSSRGRKQLLLHIWLPLSQAHGDTTDNGSKWTPYAADVNAVLATIAWRR